MNESARLQIRIKKGKDGPHSFVCVRPDGTMTMQHQKTGFFPAHDLTHYAVETVLSYRRGFYGLLAEGWNLSDFGNGWPRGRLPDDIDPAELIVGALDLERGTGHALTAAQLNTHVADWYARNAPGQRVPAPVNDEQLDRIRAIAGELHGRWFALRPGESIELRFPAD